MRKRVGLLGLLLVMALGSGAVAQSPPPLPSSSPAATPLYAPEDVAFLLPRHFGETSLTVEEGFELWSDDVGVDGLRHLLIPLGKEPHDVRFASARDSGANDGGLRLRAIRVDGVPADSLLAAHIGLYFAYDPEATSPPDYPMAWTEIDGRRVMVVRDGEAWLFFYPKGEVMFIGIAADGSGIEDVLAELP